MSVIQGTSHMDRIIRGSVALLLVIFAPVAVYMLILGASLASFLLKPERPYAIILWLSLLLFPFWLWAALKRADRKKVFYTMALSAWAYASIWGGVALGWVPFGLGDVWGW